MFNNIAAKDGNPDLDGYDWFEHLVPESLQDNPQEVEVFMNGGTVEQQVWVHDQGMASGHYETVTHDISDKDVSRIQSGANGGEYTPDNTIMEDASINRARGADNMTAQELEAAEATVEAESTLIDGGEIITEATEVAEGAVTTATEVSSDILGTVTDVASDILAPAIGAYMAGTTVANHMESEQDKIGYGLLAAGGGALLACTPPGQIAIAGVAIYKLTYRASAWMLKQLENA